MNKKILVSLFILVVLLCAISFLPLNKWIELDNSKTNLIENTNWTIEQYQVKNKILTMMSTPVSSPHSKDLKLSGSITIRKNQENAGQKIPDLPLTIDLYGGPEFDLPANDINLTYQQAKAGATFDSNFEIIGKQTNLFLRIFHYFPNYQIAGKFKLYAKPNLLQNIFVLFNKIKANFIYILIFLIIVLLISLATIISSNSKKVYLGSGIILIIIGLTIQFFPLNYFAGKNIIENNIKLIKLYEKKINAFPIVIESNKYYLISWQDRLLGKYDAKYPRWVLDLFSSKSDINEHETNRYFSKMKRKFMKNNFIVNSRNFTYGYIRLNGNWGDGVEIKDLTIRELPSLITKLHKTGFYFLIIGTLFLLLFLKTKIKNIYQITIRKYKIMIPLLILSYLIPCTIFLTKINYNNNGMLNIGIIYRFLFAPLFILVLLFIVGWPLVRFCLNGKQKNTAEFLLSFPIGFLTILSTHSLSYIGITPIWRIIILSLLVLVAWGMLFYKKQFPGLPKPVTILPLIFAVLLFWIGISPLTTQKDAYPFTKSYNDMCVYIPMIQWNMEHSMKEISKLASKHKEPPYIAYLAHKDRLTPSRAVFGNYTSLATLAFLTELSAYQIYSLMSGVFLSLIFLSIIGSLLAVKLIKSNNMIIVSALCLSFNFIILLSVWEGFYSSMVGFIALFPITALGTYAFLKQNYKFTIICGLGLAAVLNSYHQFFYLVCAQLAFALFLIILKNLITANWNKIIKIIGIGFSIFIFTILFAPQQTSHFIEKTIFHPNALGQMAQNTSGGPNVPTRSFYIINGFLGNWTYEYLKNIKINPVAYRIVSFILTIFFFIIISRMIFFRWKTWSTLFIFSSIIPYGLMIAWAYFEVSNKYIYFKALGYISPFVSAAFLIAWLDWYKISKLKLIKLCLAIIMCFWISWRILAVYGEIKNASPRRFLDDSIVSLSEIYKYVPINDCININFGNMYYSPHVITALRKRPLNVVHMFGYISWKYKNPNWKYSLENKQLENITNIWNNGTYYLYSKDDLIMQ